MIPPPAQRTMVERIGATVTETPASHDVKVSNPAVVAGRAPTNSGHLIAVAKPDDPSR